tara:strand:- start:652 stop:870 length:219 start_codon:yes stop_codon:yes gene_type:complete
MPKKSNKDKVRELSIRLKTSMAIQTHLVEMDKIKEAAALFVDEPLADSAFIKIMEETLFESLAMVFPVPFEA